MTRSGMGGVGCQGAHWKGPASVGPKAARIAGFRSAEGRSKAQRNGSPCFWAPHQAVIL